MLLDCKLQPIMFQLLKSWLYVSIDLLHIFELTEL